MDAFDEACRFSEDFETSVICNLQGAVAFRERVMYRLQQSFLDGTIEEFFDRYVNLLKVRFPEISEFPLASFCDEATKLIEHSFAVERSHLPRKAILSASDHYRLLLRYHGATLHAAATCLSPIVYWLHYPFAPSERAEDLQSLIVSIASAAPLSISETALLTALMANGIVVRAQFLRILLANETQVALGKTSNKAVVWMMKARIHDFDLAAYHLDEHEYLDSNQWYQLPTDEDAGYLEIRSIRVRKDAVRRFFYSRGLSNGLDEIDWVDVAYKLVCVRNESYEATVQGIGGALHTAIVEQLRRTGRAMRLDELQRAICIDFDLSPEILGPAIGRGKIMAYARHPRFLEKHEAYYVLSDLVETDTEKKGKIPRDRIVTPWVEKDWEFSNNEFVMSIQDDAVYELVKLVLLRRIVTTLTRMLPSRPSEPYFVRKMTERAKAFLGRCALHLGNGVYALQVDLQDFAGKFETPDVVDALRMNFISHGLGSPSNLKEAVSTLSDSGVRDDLLALI